jgi:hypothetical protein
MRFNILATAALAAAVSADKTIASHMQDYVLGQVGEFDQEGARVQKSQFDADLLYNYPGILSVAYGNKYDWRFYAAPEYYEPNYYLSGIRLASSLSAKQECFLGGLWMDEFQQYVYAKITLMEIRPLMFSFSFPNYLSGYWSEVTLLGRAGTCFDLWTDITIMGVSVKVDTYTLGWYISLTDWIVHDQDPDYAMGYSFQDEPMEVGWFTLGSLWSTTWRWWHICI